EFFTPQDEFAMNELLRSEAIAGIRAAPMRYAWGIVHGLAEFWYLTRSHTGSVIGMVINFPLLALAVAGIAVARLWRSPEGVVWIGMVAYLNLVPAMTVAVARYALPVMPILFLFIGAGVAAIAQRRSGDLNARLAEALFE